MSTSKKDSLKEREQKILSFMKKEIRQKGYPPTVREICGALGIKSTSTVHKDIESLVKQGYIVKDPSKPRALNILDPVTDNPAGAMSGSDSFGSVCFKRILPNYKEWN